MKLIETLSTLLNRSNTPDNTYNKSKFIQELLKMYAMHVRLNVVDMHNPNHITACMCTDTTQLTATYFPANKNYSLNVTPGDTGPLHRYAEYGAAARDAFDTLLMLTPSFSHTAMSRVYIVDAIKALPYMVSKNTEKNAYNQIVSYRMYEHGLKIAAMCDTHIMCGTRFNASITADKSHAPLPTRYDSYDAEFSQQIYMALQHLYDNNNQR